MKEKKQYSSLYQSQILKQVTKRKNVGKILTVMKGDKQAFGAITAKPTDLHEAFLVYINLTKLALEILL